MTDRIVRAKVVEVSGDACFLMLPNGRAGKLVQPDSLACDATVPLATLPQYQVGSEFDVYVVHEREDQGAKLAFVHERWAKNDPWPTLEEHLEEGDRVFGHVVRAVPTPTGTS